MPADLMCESRAIYTCKGQPPVMYVLFEKQYMGTYTCCQALHNNVAINATVHMIIQQLPVKVSAGQCSSYNQPQSLHLTTLLTCRLLTRATLCVYNSAQHLDRVGNGFAELLQKFRGYFAVIHSVVST